MSMVTLLLIFGFVASMIGNFVAYARLTALAHVQAKTQSRPLPQTWQGQIWLGASAPGGVFWRVVFLASTVIGLVVLFVSLEHLPL
jgi:hypothetical protein